MTKIEQIKEAITKAANNQSKLTEEILQLPSFSSAKIKHLLNNLGGISNMYFEVGVHKGGTFVASLYNNDLGGIAVDNWTEFEENGESKKLFEKNISLLRNGQYRFIEKDCFELNPPEWHFSGGGIDFYLYDGNHADWAQKQALTHFAPILSNEFIYCVDDSSWESVKNGTRDGIEECGFKILFEQQLWDGKEGSEWWNGFTVYLLKKVEQV